MAEGTEEEAEDPLACLEDLNFAAHLGLKSLQAAKCNVVQCKGVGMVFHNLLNLSSCWKTLFCEEFVAGEVQNVALELVKATQAAARLVEDYSNSGWLSKVLFTQENAMGFLSAVEEIGRYVQMLNRQIDCAAGHGYLSKRALIQKLEEKSNIDCILIRAFLEKGAKKDRDGLKIRVDEQRRTPAPLMRFFSRLPEFKRSSTGILASKLATRDSTTGLSPFDIAPNELEFHEFLGEGGFGKVYRGTWMGLPVAVKEAPEDDRHFNTEAEIMKGLQPSHPNIVQILGLQQDPTTGAKRLVMELMDKDLKVFFKQRRLQPLLLLDSVDVMLQIASGMLHLHNNGVMYRDLKLQNVLVKSEGSRLRIKLADFGHSKAQFNSLAYDHTTPVGTTDYMAPEVRMASPYTKKADVYSFSIACSEILTGGPSRHGHPLRAKAPSRNGRSMKWELDERPVLPADCPPQLKNLIERCWDWEPQSRPSFAEICESLWQIKEEQLTGRRPVNMVLTQAPSIVAASPSQERSQGPGSPSISSQTSEGTCSEGEQASLGGTSSFEISSDEEQALPGPEQVPDPEKALQEQVPSPEKALPEQVPCPEQALQEQVPGLEQALPGPEQALPGSEQASPVTSSPGIFGLVIQGENKVGTKLTATWSFGNGSSSCAVLWGRYHHNTVPEPRSPIILTATAAEYILTPDDLHTHIGIECLPFAPGSMQPGGPACYISRNPVCRDARSEGEVTRYVQTGYAEFKVRIDGQVMHGRLNLSRPNYQLWWNLNSTKNFRESYTEGVSLELPGDPGSSMCILKRSTGRAYSLRFIDTYKRNLAVMTMREFLGRTE